MEELKAREGEGSEGRGLLAFFYSDALMKTDRLPYYKEERNKIRDILAESGRKIRFRSERATVQSIRSRLTSGCQMLHFNGHGCEEYLEFESERHCGEAELIKDGDLRDLIKAGDIVPDLVFLGSSKSDIFGRAVATARVPHVVAVKSGSDVSDEATRYFSASFYDELIAKSVTVQKAFDIAVSAVKTNAPTTAAHFLLLPEDDNHEVKMFNDLPKGHFIDETPPPPLYFNLPPTGNTYIGRVELQNVLSMLENDDTACVTITGEPGVGKTERALQACHYMGERNRFSAIFFADCKKAVKHACPFPTSGRPEAHIQRLCRLIGVALDASQGIGSSKDLVEYLNSESGREPTKILLVLDAANALIEGGGIEARKSLADFVDALFCAIDNLNLLVTSDQGLLELTGRCLSNSTEKVSPLQINRGLGDPEVKKTAIRYNNQNQVNPRNTFSEEHANEVSSQAKLLDKRCRDIWLRAISSAAKVGLIKGYDYDECYRHVPWISLPLALNQALCEIQTTFNGVGMSVSRGGRPRSEGSSRSFNGLHHSHGSSSGEVHRQSPGSGSGSGSSFGARDLQEDELDFIRNLLRNSLKRDVKSLDGSECGANISNGRISTGYGYPGKDEEHEWFSLKAFVKFSLWMGPVVATLSKIQKDWVANEPVKVHGFVSNNKAKRLLLDTGRSGVFMLRFSVKFPGCLVLVVTCKASHEESTSESSGILYPTQFRITVKEDGEWVLHRDRSRTTFRSLLDLVHDESSLMTLYPDIPKEDAFPITSPTASSNISLVTVEENDKIHDELPRDHGN